jgi:hypothetical protein
VDTIGQRRREGRKRSAFFDGDATAQQKHQPRLPIRRFSSLSSSVTSSCSSFNTVDLEEDRQPQTSQTASSKPKQSRRSVRFGSINTVRTYNVTFGDHPWCEAYPISLDWDYVENVQLQQQEDDDDADADGMCTFDGNTCKKKFLHRRSLEERKSLLMEVAGYTERQLEDWQREEDLRRSIEKQQEKQREYYDLQQSSSTTSWFCGTNYYYDDNGYDIQEEILESCKQQDSDRSGGGDNKGGGKSGGLTRVKSVDACLSRVLNTIVNAAA